MALMGGPCGCQCGTDTFYSGVKEIGLPMGVSAMDLLKS